MSLNVPARRIAGMASRSTSVVIGRPSLHLRYLRPSVQTRSISLFGWGTPSSKSPLAQELSKQELESKLRDRMVERKQGTSIFDEEASGAKDGADGAEPAKKADKQGPVGISNVKEHMQRALDPDPRWRVRFQKKMVMQMVRKGGALTKEQRINLVEKKSVTASPILPTSTKKLVHLAHQIAGKTVDDAITQMRFSKKKMAREVKIELEKARAEAIAARGMGLGQTLDKPKKIQTKDGKHIEITDPTTLYVDESWVTKGPWRGQRIQYHARGRMSRMWRPTTRLHLVLKEEKTRIRQHEEKVEKQAKAKPWIHLPNRPVTAQRPYYTW